MDKEHLDLINKILDLPIHSDMAGFDFNINCNSNGRGPVWKVEYKFTSPYINKTFELSSEFYEREGDGLKFILEGLLSYLEKGS